MLPSRAALLLVVLLLVLIGAPGPRDLAPPPDDGIHGRIVNGVLTGGHPSVGALLRGNNPHSARAWCSGTLIGCETFLTAAHCVERLGARDLLVFLPHAGFFGVAGISVHPSFAFPVADVAVLKLGEPVTGIVPSAINRTAPPPPGTPGTIVGFGRSGGPHFDYGLKRAGRVTTARCGNVPSGGSDTTLVCWDFVAPVGPAGTDSNTCNADSGGPLLADLGAGEVVAGITSGGASSSCLAADHSYDANVFTYRGFIDGAAGADRSGAACGDLPSVGTSGANVRVEEGTLGDENPEDTYTLTVPPTATVLRIAMNGVDDGSDFDLYVKAGSAPTPLVYDCGRFGGNQYGFCEFVAPATGEWHVLVQRYAGAGPYQLTIGSFGADCADPANAGVACDDGRACTADDRCQAGVCAGNPLADGTPCDDGNGCSQPDTCQAGTCVGAPPSGCRLPLRSKAAMLRLVDRTPDTRDSLVWKWRKGAATSRADLGDPTGATDYALCIHDETAGAPPALVLEQMLPAGPAWRSRGRSISYRDRTLARGGIASVSLREGADGRAAIVVRGKGERLALPSLPFGDQAAVVVRLLNGSACWEARYGTSLRNDATQFKAKSD